MANLNEDIHNIRHFYHQQNHPEDPNFNQNITRRSSVIIFKSL